MLYSKKQRREIYKKALINYRSNLKKVHGNPRENHVIGACEAIQMVITGSYEDCDDDITEESFPELFLFRKPSLKAKILWLDDKGVLSRTERINVRELVLMFCIEMIR